MSATGFLFVVSRQHDARLAAIEAFLADLGYSSPEGTVTAYSTELAVTVPSGECCNEEVSSMT